MVSLDEAKIWLRIDHEDFDQMILALLRAAPGYIEAATGMSEAAQLSDPLADTLTRFLLILWFDVQDNQAERIQRAIDNMLKAITVRARSQQTG